MLGLQVLHAPTQDIQKKKITTLMTDNISMYFSKQLLIAELYREWRIW